jgi:putative transposase
VFLSPRDYERFLEQLDHCLEMNQVRLYAYCLLTNHYHLFVETPLGNVQRFMQRLNTAYAMYFRYKYDRPGHCWQGRYGAKLVNGDDYILRLTRYIHLNPVKTPGRSRRSPQKVWERLSNYKWSSFAGYTGLCEAEERIDYRWLGLLGETSVKGSQKAYSNYVRCMAAKDDEEFLKEYAASGYAIGDEDYREDVADKLREKKRREGSARGDVAWPEDRLPSVQDIEAVVLKECGVGRDKVHCHGHHGGVVKSMVVELCCRMSGSSQRDVGRYFGYGSDSGVSKQRRRFAEVFGRDKGLADRFGRLESRVRKSIVQV